MINSTSCTTFIADDVATSGKLRVLASLNDNPAEDILTPIARDLKDLNADDYNKLLLVSKAEALFEEQLKSSGIDRAVLFSQLAPLFSHAPEFLPGLDGHKYAVYLIHRHYELKPNERMVATDCSTKPSTEYSSNIAAHIWSMAGVALEYRHFPNGFPVPKPPSEQLLTLFRSILNKAGIDTLGICYFDNDLKDGDIYQEGDGPGDRERLVTMIPESLAPTDSYEVMWSPKYNPDTKRLILAVRCCCNGVGCWTTTIGPVVSLTLQPNTIATIFGVCLLLLSPLFRLLTFMLHPRLFRMLP